MTEPSTPKRGRGRPRKPRPEVEEEKPKRGRGRPPGPTPGGKGLPFDSLKEYGVEGVEVRVETLSSGKTAYRRYFPDGRRVDNVLRTQPSRAIVSGVQMIPEYDRTMPETRPDEVILDHKWMCACNICTRPGAEYWKGLKIRRQVKGSVGPTKPQPSLLERRLRAAETGSRCSSDPQPGSPAG